MMLCDGLGADIGCNISYHGLYIKKRVVEPVGEYFEIKVFGEQKEKVKEPTADSNSTKKDKKSELPSIEENLFGKKNKQRTGKSWKLDELLEGIDLYEFMEVTRTATDDEIRTAFRRLSLERHPDRANMNAKCTGNAEDFVKLQKAVEILRDPELRRLYDSTLAFDDTLPSTDDLLSLQRKPTYQTDFFDLVRPIFQSWAQWSSNGCSKDIGDMNTTQDKVRRFYQNWNQFSTIRQFPDVGEHTNLEGYNRDERRWLERQNQKARAQAATNENDKVRGFIKVCESVDPRCSASGKSGATLAERAKAAMLAKKEAQKNKKK